MRDISRGLKLTVISASNNSISGIEKLYTSLQSQTYTNWEWIVHDNDSDDGTFEFLSNISDDRVVFSSFKDQGIYHAFNICLEKVTGQKIIFLGTDDFLFDQDVFKCLVEFPDFFNRKFICGIMMNYSVKNNRYFAVNDFSPINYNDYPGHAFPPFPSLFIEASVFKDYRFDEKNIYHSDLLFFYENLNNYEEISRINVVISCMGDQGLTSDVKTRKKRIKEKYKIFKSIASNKEIESIFGSFSIYTKLKIKLRYWLF